MKVVLPRVIYGNRGDLASRWGVLLALHQLGVEDIRVFSEFRNELPDISLNWQPYGKLRNLILDKQSWKSIKNADVVFWSVGLDLQDDSSLAKLIYLFVLFNRFKAAGLKVICLFQGAGPINTRIGRLMARHVLKHVDLFVARDPGTAALVKNILPTLDVQLGFDGIFLPGFELEAPKINNSGFWSVNKRNARQPVIGINLRQWFHFSSQILPYQFRQKAYRTRSVDKMDLVLQSMDTIIKELRHTFDAQVKLVSAYQSGSVPWEDDLPWLKKLKERFQSDVNIELIEAPLSLPEYYKLISEMDLMIGMRLHSSLIALRMGVPAINISYTLKGKDIYTHLGLHAWVFDLNTSMEDPWQIIKCASDILENLDENKSKTKKIVEKSVTQNVSVLSKVMKGIH
jgi:polysaccharide pyruvyl transferase WcaK-like protein